ncbi:hypothetical protein C1645_154339 [Glomus cerebriforme]|uniref:Uncharacterized protein n=1 Tax=Glomus cerebriforme TaxID=658196 RepID=A0A397T614_9GLOM|nr:hypothetical protein C1645_154339 [Glomus cerebriforme]
MSQSSDTSAQIDYKIDIEKNITIDVENKIATDVENKIATDVENKIATDVEKNNSEKNDKPHNGKPITMIELSPNETYLVTYSPENKSFIGWNVENVEGEFQLKPDDYCHIIDEYVEHRNVVNMCVSDDKKLAYIRDIWYLNLIDMNNDGQKIELDFGYFHGYNYFCTFNLKNEFILHSRAYERNVYKDKNNISVYFTKTKNNKWMCKRIHDIPEGYDVISISKHDKLYLLFSNIYIHEWDPLTETSIRIFGNEEKIEVIKLNTLCIIIN